MQSAILQTEQALRAEYQRARDEMLDVLHVIDQRWPVAELGEIRERGFLREARKWASMAYVCILDAEAAALSDLKAKQS